MPVIQKVMTTGQGRVWLQPEGPASPFVYGGCYGMGDMAIPEGDLTPIFCPSPTQYNKWDVKGQIRGTPGQKTTSLEAPLETVNYLHRLLCPFGIHVRLGECGTPDAPDDWETIIAIRGAQITNRGITNLNMRTPDGNAEILTTADISFDSYVIMKRLNMSAVATGAGATGHIQALSFCDDVSCPGACGAGGPGCQTGYAVTAGITINGEQIRKTEDGGATWEAITSPFTSLYDDIVDVACKGEVVIIVNGTTAGQIGRSQDGGDTWSVVSLPDAIIARSVFMLDQNNVWVAGDDGYVWYSADGGLTWETQANGGATTEDLLDIFMFDIENGWAVGEAGSVIATTDGDTWAAQSSGTANQLNTVHFITQFIGYAGGNSGTLLKTIDGGNTWTVQSWFGAVGDTINSISSCEEQFVYFAGTTTAPAGFIYQSIDGGATAKQLVLPSNTGLNEIFCCVPNPDQLKIYAGAQAGQVILGA